MSENSKPNKNISYNASDFVINPTLGVLAKFLYDLNDKTQAELSIQGLLRFAHSKSGDTIFGDAINYYHADLRKILNQPENNLEGFLTGDRILQIRKETAENYFNKNNPTVDDIVQTSFYKTFRSVIKGIEFLY